jgi:hypothetical protein
MDRSNDLPLPMKPWPNSNVALNELDLAMG